MHCKALAFFSLFRIVSLTLLLLVLLLFVLLRLCSTFRTTATLIRLTPQPNDQVSAFVSVVSDSDTATAIGYWLLLLLFLLLCNSRFTY